MKVVKLAAGLAVGYVLGSRAGREKYDQILETVRRINGRPAEEPAAPAPAVQSGVETAVQSGVQSGVESTAKPTVVPRPPRRKPVVATPGVESAPLV